MTELVFCVGSGGVGKTTVSSMLACHQAQEGKRVLVITIDPAQRLRDSLGLENAHQRPQRVKVDKILPRGPVLKGELFAYVPNLKQEWRNFLQTNIADSKQVGNISHNPFYGYFVESLPGALEIICSHLVMRFFKAQNYDVIILDTPPSSSSLAFFDVPQKISRVLEQNLFRALMSKRHSFLLRLTKKLAFFSSGLLNQTLERLVGSHFLSEVLDFALTIDELYEPLLARTKEMESLLVSPSTRYVLVARPNLANLDDSKRLKAALDIRGLALHQVVINQMWPAPGKSLGLEQDQRGAQVVVLDQLIGYYQREYDYQQKVLKLFEQELRGIDCRVLGLSRAMADLLTDYQLKSK